MKNRLRVLISIGLLISCNSYEPNSKDQDSDTKALEGNDWFKSGVDRFYLAYMASDERISEDEPELQGQQYFFGIGCYNEPIDPETVVSVQKASDSTDTVSVKLNGRTMLHQFPLDYETTGRPAPGRCKILLGDEQQAQQVSNAKKLSTKTDYVGLSLSYLGAGVSCLGTVAAGAKFAAALAGGTYVTAQTAGTAGAVALPVVLTEGVAFIGVLHLCTWKSHETHKLFQKSGFQRNQSIFVDSLSAAALVVNRDIRLDRDLNTRYQNLSRDGEKLQVAAALWNTRFVRVFNSQINERFENGWHQGTRFFDAVSQVQTSLLAMPRTFKN